MPSASPLRSLLCLSALVLCTAAFAQTSSVRVTGVG